MPVVTEDEFNILMLERDECEKDLKRQLEKLQEEKDKEREEAGKSELQWRNEVKELEASEARLKLRVQELHKAVDGGSADVISDLRTQVEDAEAVADQMEKDLRDFARASESEKVAALAARLDKADDALRLRGPRQAPQASPQPAATQSTEVVQLTVDNEALRQALAATHDTAAKYQRSLDEIEVLKAEAAQLQAFALEAHPSAEEMEVDRSAEVVLSAHEASFVQPRASPAALHATAHELAVARAEVPDTDAENLAAAKAQVAALQEEIDSFEALSDELDGMKKSLKKATDKLERTEKSDKAAKEKLRTLDKKLKEAEKKHRDAERSHKKVLQKKDSEIEDLQEAAEARRAEEADGDKAEADLKKARDDLAAAKAQSLKLTEKLSEKDAQLHEYQRFAMHYKKEAKVLDARVRREEQLRLEAEEAVAEQRMKRIQVYEQWQRKGRELSRAINQEPSTRHERRACLPPPPPQSPQSTVSSEPPKKRSRHESRTAAPHPVSRREASRSVKPREPERSEGTTRKMPRFALQI